MFLQTYIVALNQGALVTCYYSETNLMHFIFSILRIKYLFIFRALLAHPQEVFGILRVCYVSWLHHDLSGTPLFIQIVKN
jgi:hypothetical protein